MLSTSKEVYAESRKSLRIKEKLDLKWQIKDSQFNGNGRVLNISTSGMLFETRRGFPLIDRCVFDFQSFIGGKANFLPQEGRLVWAQKVGLRKNKMLCGIEFIDPQADILSELREKVQSGIVRMANARRTKSIVGTILFISMILLSAFVVKQHTENYYSIQQSHQKMVVNYQGQAALSNIYSKELTVAKTELSSTKNLLVEAEQLLAAAQAEKVELQALVDSSQMQVAQMTAEKAEFNTAMAQLNESNAAHNVQISSLKERLSVLEVNIQSMDEGKSLITLYRDKMRTVRTQMKGLKKEAHYAKIAAQSERDRVESMFGNNGYFVKDGKAFEPKDSGNMSVNVEFFCRRMVCIVPKRFCNGIPL